jgi:hypothetical protein
MPTQHDLVMHIAAAELPDSVVFQAQEQLISELNERGPIADALNQGSRRGTKGLELELGQIGLALLSAGVVKHIAQIIIEFVKRTNDYEVTLGDIKISKKNASSREMEEVNNYLLKILANRPAAGEPR